MKKIYVLMIGMATGVLLTACGQNGNSQAVLEDEGTYGHDSVVESESSGAGEAMPLNVDTEPVEIGKGETETSDEAAQAGAKNQGTEEGMTNMRIRITVGDTELYAVLEDNATTRALLQEMPMTLSMQDLYGREMCYRYGADAFPADTLRSDGYEVGDIAYWPPRGSLVILYGQNEEQFERQHIGHISEGVEVFETTGDVEVTFEIAEDGRK